MELFNYISVAVSIILGISATHLLSGLRDVIAPHRRDWLVVCWYALPRLSASADMVVFLRRARHPELELGDLYDRDGGTRLSLPGFVHSAVRGSRSCSFLERALPEDSPLVFHLLRSFHCDVSSPRDSLAGATVTWSC